MKSFAEAMGGCSIKTTAAQAHECQMLSCFYAGMAELPPETTIEEAVGIIMKTSRGRLNPKKLYSQVLTETLTRQVYGEE